MMKQILVIALVLFQMAPSIAQEQVLPDYHQRADKLINDAIVQKQCTGIAAGFSINGEIKWQAGAGYNDLKNQNAFEHSTLTRIASIAKPLTAIAIMQLYEQGKLDLDQPIQTYLPEFPIKAEGDISIRQLLQHTAGLAGYSSEKEQENKINYPALADAVALFEHRDLIAAPGTAFNYTTYGYVVLGLVIEKVSGMSYGDYLQKNIYDKAGMENTGIEYFDKHIPNKSGIFHRNQKGKIKEAKPTNLSDRIPGGGLYSTVTDMLKFGHAVLNNMLISESSLQMMLEDPKLKKDGNGYGLGWYLYGENPNYGNVFGHNGAQTGASTFLMLLPEQKTTIVVLSNTSGALQSVSNITVQLFDVAALAAQ